jgi:hypothetical protein
MYVDYCTPEQACLTWGVRCDPAVQPSAQPACSSPAATATGPAADGTDANTASAQGTACPAGAPEGYVMEHLELWTPL